MCLFFFFFFFFKQKTAYEILRSDWSSGVLFRSQQGIEALRAPGPLWQDRGGKPDLLLRRAGRTVTHFRTPHLQCADPRLEAPLRAMPVPDHTLPALRQHLLRILGDKEIHFRLQRRRQHPASALLGDLRQRVGRRSKLANGNPFLFWKFWQVGPRHETPPFLPPSPIRQHGSSMARGG